MTLYSDIFQRAIYRFIDFSFLNKQLTDAEIDAIYCKYLMSAVADFENKCKYDLTDRDEVQMCFNQTLPDKVQEILAQGMAYYWVSSKVLNSELLKNKLSTKEYSYFSPANLLKELQTLRDSLRKEFERNMVRYSYDIESLSNLEV